jgi:hypothetical protein
VGEVRAVQRDKGDRVPIYLGRGGEETTIDFVARAVAQIVLTNVGESITSEDADTPLSPLRACRFRELARSR